jgi:molecular chaperone GrpE
MDHSETNQPITPEEPEVLETPSEPTAEELITAEKEKYLRLAAEYDNYRKRSRAERDTFYGEVKAETVKAFLEVHDTLELAVKAETADSAYKKGVELTFKQLQTVFERLGVTAIEAGTGTAFDPAIHEAIAHIEDESLGANVVAEELRKGFKLGDKVIRCSMVKSAN